MSMGQGFIRIIAILTVVLVGCVPKPPRQPTTAPEVIVRDPVDDKAAKGFAIIRNDNGVWAFEQQGKRFVSLGVCVVNPVETNPTDPSKAYNGLRQFNGDLEAWASFVKQRLTDWGFNTIGAWSHEAANRCGLPYCRVVWLGGYSGHGRTLDMRLIDVFNPAYADRIDRQALEQVAPHAEDTALLGFYINNELPFYGDFGWPTDPDRSLWDRYLSELPPDAPGRKEAARFFRNRYATLEEAQADWEIENLEDIDTCRKLNAKTLQALRFKYEWAGHVADRYFSLASAAIRKYAPHHILLGSRHAGRPIAAVVRAESKYVDVISINHYRPDGTPDLGLLRSLHALTGKPILITEFSWRAMENTSGNRNTRGAEVTVQTQADRAANYRRFVGALLAEPYIIGAHWFQYYDEPADGRSFDGEDSNYGLVDIFDRPYDELVMAAAEVNRAVLQNADKRTPIKIEFDPLVWGELLPIRLDGGALAAPVALDFATTPTTIVADDGNQAQIMPVDRGVRIAYQTGDGWGLHADFELPKKLAGARQLRMKFTGVKNHRYQIFLTETGAGPPGQQVYQGEHGADGESFEYRIFSGEGEPQEMVIKLDEGMVRRFWGNQRGDRVLSTAGLKTLSFYVFGGQGAGEVHITDAAFEP
jgi:hypothetical protein